jgi:hypothetical protein
LRIGGIDRDPHEFANDADADTSKERDETSHRGAYGSR